MPDILKLRMKVGVHEFDAEGPAELVRMHLDTWKRLAGLTESTDAVRSTAATAAIEGADPTLTKLFAVDAQRQTILLRIIPGGPRRNRDVALLLLYGYHQFLAAADEDSLPGVRLKALLAACDLHPTRIDRVMAPYLASRLVRKSGRHTHEVYALTAAGREYAAALARQLAHAL